MTLCVGWRNQGQLFFAADSRVSFAGKAPFDGAVKIVPVPFNVDSMHPYTGSDETLFQGNLGLCFSGSTVNAFALRESLYDQLSRLFAPSYSMASIAEQVFEIYQRVSRELCYALAGPEGQSQVMLTGYCIESGHERAFLLSPVSSAANDYYCEPILEHDGEVAFYGSGRGMALGLSQQGRGRQDPEPEAATILQNVIDDVGVESVGGRIRYGYFDKQHSFHSRWF